MIQDYGHWSVLREVDLNTVLGFVYVITFEDGKKYIGAKKIWKRIKTPPSTYKRSPKRGFEMSDWRTYTSSSNEVNEMINSGVYPSSYLIVGWYDSWGKTLMAEAEMQLQNNVLTSDIWLNKQIGGHFNPNCYDELTQEDIVRYSRYEVGNIHTSYPVMYKFGHKTKYVNPDEIEKYLNDGWEFGRSPLEKVPNAKKTIKVFSLYDISSNEIVHVENQKEWAIKNNVLPEHLSRLLSGDLDSIQCRWSLPPEIRRKTVCVIDGEGREFTSIQECDAANGFKRGATAYRLKNKLDGFKKIKIESRAEYKKRLREEPPFSMKVVECSSEKILFTQLGRIVNSHPAVKNGDITFEEYIRNCYEYYFNTDYSNSHFHPSYPNDKYKAFKRLTRPEMIAIMESENFEYDEKDTREAIAKKYKKQFVKKLKNNS